MRYATAAALLAAFIACNGEPPPPPPPTCEELPQCTATGGAWDDVACSCSCPEGTQWLGEEGCVEVSPPPPPPPPPPPVLGCDTPIADRERADYIPTNQADFWEHEIPVYDQRLIWNGVRNPSYALLNCPDGGPNSVWPYNGIEAEDALDVVARAREAKEALSGADGESEWAAPGKFRDPNRRCKDPNAEPRDPWCGRSNVYRPCFMETWREVRALTDGCVDADCTEFHPPTNPIGPVSRLDGVRGACQDQQGGN